MNDLHSTITSDPLRRNGRPCVRDLRISVGDVLGVDGGPGPWAVIDATGGALLAVYVAHRGDTVKPSVVLV